MKKLQKAKDTGTEQCPLYSPKWPNGDKNAVDTHPEQEQEEQQLSKIDAPRDRRRKSTRASPDSRPRSSERISNPIIPKTTKSQFKRNSTNTARGGNQRNDLMKPKRKLIQKNTTTAQRNVKSQQYTRGIRPPAAYPERLTRFATQNFKDINEIKDKNIKNTGVPAVGGVDLTQKRYSRSQNRRGAKMLSSNTGALGKGACDEESSNVSSHSDPVSNDDQLAYGNYENVDEDHLLNNNANINFDKNSKTKSQDHQQITLDLNNNQFAPTTSESKNIVQQHNQLHQLTGLGLSDNGNHNINNLTPNSNLNIDSATLKTLNTTNYIYNLFQNHQHSQLNQQSTTGNQIQKDMALGISAAANSIIRNNAISSQSIGKNRAELHRDVRSRSKGNRVVNRHIIGLVAHDKSGTNTVDIGAQKIFGQESESDKEEEVRGSNFNIDDERIILGTKNAEGGSTVDIQIEGSDSAMNSKSLRKIPQTLTQPIPGQSHFLRRTKEAGSNSIPKSKKSALTNNDNAVISGRGSRIASVDIAKNNRSKSNLKESKSKETDVSQGLGSSRQLRGHKQSSKKVSDQKQQPKSMINKREKKAARKNTRDKSKDRIVDDGCAVLEDQHKQPEMVVTINKKQTDDFAHAFHGNKNQQVGPIIIHKEKRQKLRDHEQDSEQWENNSQSGSDGQSSEYEIEDDENDHVEKHEQKKDFHSRVSQIGKSTSQNNLLSHNGNQGMSLQNQLEQLISFVGVGDQNSNSQNESDKQKENELNRLGAQLQSQINHMPLTTMNLTQIPGNNTQINQLGLHTPLTQKQSNLDIYSNNGGYNNYLSQIANVAKLLGLNQKAGTTSVSNIGPATQLNHGIQSKSQLGFKTPIPIMGVGQTNKINYDDSDFNGICRKIQNQTNQNQNRRDSKSQNNFKQDKTIKNIQQILCDKNNEDAKNLLTLFNAREHDRQQQEAKKQQTQLQIGVDELRQERKILMAQQTQAARAAGLDELDEFTQRYQILKEVGRGAFGSVFKALDRRAAAVSKSTSSQDNFVAIKKLFYDRKYEQREVPMLVEIRNKKLNDNIIKLKDRYLKTYQEVNKKKPWQQENKEYLFIVTDYLPHTICDLNVNPTIYLTPNGQESAVIPSNVSAKQLAQAKTKCLESIRQVMLGVFKGLRDLHSIGITHRDIKLSNILLDNDRLPITKVKICDLGSSKKLMSNVKDQSTQSLNYIGTRSFRAPELLVGNRYYDTKIDIWSAGVVFLKLLLGYLNKKSNLFNVSDTKGLAKVIVDQIGDPVQSELDEMLASNELMSNSVKQGLTESEIMKKRFKKLDAQMKNQIPADSIDILHKILQLSPQRRISAEEALKHPYFANYMDETNKESVNTKFSMINRTTETTSPCTNPNTMFFNQNHHN